ISTEIPLLPRCHHGFSAFRACAQRMPQQGWRGGPDGEARRPEQGDHRAPPGGRPPVLRGDRPRRRALRGRGPPASPTPRRGRLHADRRGDRPPPGGVQPAGDDRPDRRRRHHPGRRRPRRPRRGVLRRDDRGQLRHPRRGRLRGRRGAADPDHRPYPRDARGAHHRDLRLPQAHQAALQLGDQMTHPPTTSRGTDLQQAARDHLWMHFTRPAAYGDGARVPVIVRGEGHRIWDDTGKEYIDGLAGLFVVQVGHGRKELSEAAARQAEQLAFFPLWSYAHPAAIELAERLAAGAPGDLDHVFFTTGGGEAVESAWKLAKQYFKLTGKPHKHKVISRAVAYHGTPQGALSITGLPPLKADFEPLVPGAHKVPNTNIYRAAEDLREDPKAFGRWAADRIAEAIEFEGPETVAAVFLEPVQNAGGCFPPPPGYFERVREICDEYDVLLVSDEVICAFGRIGSMFASTDFGYTPDIITCAKGMTSGYSPLAA